MQLKHHNLPKGFSSQWIYFNVLLQYAKFQNKYVVNLQQNISLRSSEPCTSLNSKLQWIGWKFQCFLSIICSFDPIWQASRPRADNSIKPTDKLPSFHQFKIQVKSFQAMHVGRQISLISINHQNKHHGKNYDLLGSSHYTEGSYFHFIMIIFH